MLKRYHIGAYFNFFLYVKPDACDTIDHGIYREYRCVRRSHGLCRRPDESVFSVLQTSCRKSCRQIKQIQSIIYRGCIHDNSMYRIYSCTERGSRSSIKDHQRSGVCMLFGVYGHLDVEYAAEREDWFRYGILRNNECPGDGGGTGDRSQCLPEIRIQDSFLYCFSLFCCDHYSDPVYKR